MRHCLGFVWCITAILGVSTVCRAAAGDLDLTFNVTGKVTTVVSSGSTASNVLGGGTAVQSDGKVVVTGLCSNGTNNDFCLVRYNTDGSLDTSFDGDGRVLRPLGTRFDNSIALAIQPDGKIVVVGTYQFSTANNNFIGGVARFNSNGSLDTTFSGVGFKFVIMEIATSVAIQSDGKIVVAGYNTTTATARVQRVNANGSDDSFGNSGNYAEITFGPGRTDIFNAVAIQADGRIVVSGSSASGSPSFAVARLTTAGLLDTTFDTDGLVITALTGTARSVLAQPDGKIITAGTNSGNDFALVRYNANGSLDTSFDTDGIVTTNIIGTEAGNSAQLQSDGKIVVGGSAGNVNGNDFALVRYNPNGSLDSSFSTDGIVTIDFGTTSDFGYGTALDAQGRIVIAGTSGTLFAAARVQGDNAVSVKSRADFDGDGKTDLSVFRPSEGNWYLNRSTAGFGVIKWGIATDILVPGDFDGDGKADTVVARFDANSANPDFFILDSAAFTLSGVSWGLPNDVPVSGDYDGDGKTDVAVFRPSNNTWYVLRSSGGITVEPFGLAGDVPLAIDNDGDGKTNLAIFRPSSNTWYIARPTGTPATSFDAVPFGQAGDKLVPADYDGDNKDDVAVFRPSTGQWIVRGSLAGTTTFSPWGISTDIPVPGDYDGDGRDDLAVYRGGTWYVNRSSTGTFIQQFGITGDLPLPNAFVR